jgi:glycosyltransferase involved in cell wall biosynthesis
MQNPQFTIGTCTYNRAHTLHRVYGSLAAQTYRDFEWLVVDDGSTDGTRERVGRWQREAAFPIRYVWQPNGGKHIAANRAHDEARGKLYLGLDSDDGCVPQALERMKHHWDAIPRAERHRFCGATALCMDEKGALVGTRFPREVIDSDSVEIRYRYKVKGEKWGFMRTEVLRAHPFPEVAGVRFVTEATVYRRIAQKYRIRYFNEALRIYYSHDADQSSRLVNSAVRDAASMRLYLRDVLLGDLRWFRHDPVRFLRDAANFGRFSLDCGVALPAQFAELPDIRARLLWLLGLPAGFLYHLKDVKGS